MRIILLDARLNFRSDVRNRLLIDDERSVVLLTDLGSSSGLDTAVARFKPDALVVADNVYPERSTWDTYGIPVVGYLSKKTAPDVFRANNTPSYGAVENATHLLNLLEVGLPKPPAAQPAMASVTPPTVSAATTGVPAGTSISRNAPIDDSMSTPAPKGLPVYHTEPVNNYTAPTEKPSYAPEQTLPPQQEVQTPASAYSAPPTSQPLSVKERIEEQRRQAAAAEGSQALMQDLQPSQVKTQTVAVYSAKGGVGKTTIATELAVCLSLISQGRGHLRVCLIDYNIDFGDVLTTLNLDTKGPNLRNWAGEIRRRMNGGETADSITYNAREIEERLQRLGDSSLYALVAPIAHEDSMEIESVELEIILNNIIRHGKFDFVICDTGNNTRDSTVIALESADDVLLVATQDVSAVNCDNSFLNTMKKIGFDTNKIKLIVNNIMPVKYTQVTVQEVENYFPYPCIARFKRDPGVTRANNCSEPLVYTPNHPFTQEMRKVCAHLLGRELPPQKKKGGLFSRFKK